MSRTIESVQAARALSAELVPVDLVRLTTFSDRVLETVSKTFYFSRQAMLFDWADEGTDREFLPALREIRPLEMTMNHLPSEADADLLNRQLTIVLANDSFAGTRLAEELRLENVASARIEWHRLLIKQSEVTSPRLVLTGYAGSEPTVLFDGRVTRAAPISDESVTLQCDLGLPPVSWLRANDETKTDPIDLGKRLPIIYGAQKRQPCINYDVGFVTTLAEAITDVQTGTIEVTDPTGFATAGDATIGTESISWTGKSATTLTGVTRGQNSTTAAAHGVGESIIETITTATFVVAGHDVSAIPIVYIQNPRTNELIRIDETEFTFTKTVADTVDGESMATVKFTAAQLRALVEGLALDVDAPSFEAFFAPFQDQSGVLDPVRAHLGWTPDCVCSVDASGITLTADFGTIDQGAGMYYPPFRFVDGTRVVQRFRLRILYDRVAPPTAGSASLLMEYEWPGVSGAGDQDVIEIVVGGSSALDLLHHTQFHTPPAATTLADFEASFENSPTNRSDSALFTIDPPGSAGPVQWLIKLNKSGIEFELDPVVTKLTGGASVGYGLRMFADVDGYEAPAATPLYKAGTGNLMTKPCDVMRHWIEIILGQSIETSSYDDCNTNLGSAAWAFDARSIGNTGEGVLARMGYEARANLVPEQTQTGIEWEMLTALSTFQFPAATLALTEWAPGGFAEGEVDLAFQAASRFLAHYDFDPTLAGGSLSDASFHKVLRCASDDNDLTVPSVAELNAAEDRIGVIEAPPLHFLCVRDDATAKDLLGYYAHERIRGTGSAFSIASSPAWEGYDLEPGDLRNLTPPWSSTARKCRILTKIESAAGISSELRAVEVE